jgi:hypothetical protein
MSFHYTTELTFSFDAKPTEAVKIIIIFEKWNSNENFLRAFAFVESSFVIYLLIFRQQQRFITRTHTLFTMIEELLSVAIHQCLDHNKPILLLCVKNFRRPIHARTHLMVFPGSHIDWSVFKANTNTHTHTHVNEQTTRFLIENISLTPCDNKLMPASCARNIQFLSTFFAALLWRNFISKTFRLCVGHTNTYEWKFYQFSINRKLARNVFS